MPIAVLNAYVAMLDRLRAEDSMRQATVLAVGTGVMDKKDRREIVRGWEKEANPERVSRKLTPQERAAMAARIGIRIG